MSVAAAGAAEVFEQQRPRLLAIAYRMLGSVAEAEDAVQDAWLAWQRARPGAAGGRDVAEPAAYLTTVVTRRCIDVLRSARVRREQYPGPWLPEPLLGAEPDVADAVVLAESVRMAFMVVLESLSPSERAAFVLHDVFGYGYGDLAGILGRSEGACRQLVSRARGRLRHERPRPAPGADAAALADAFLAAAATGDVERLLSLLHPEATLTSDGGGRVSAARRVVTGAAAVARFLAGISARFRAEGVEPAVVNAAPGAVVREAGGVAAVASIDIEAGLVRRIHMVRNPDKLRHVAAHHAPERGAGTSGGAGVSEG